MAFNSRPAYVAFLIQDREQRILDEAQRAISDPALLAAFPYLPGYLVPVNSVAPTITGTAEVGETLTAHAGTWSHSPTSFSRVWLRCDAAGLNPVATDGRDATYEIQPEDAGHTIRLQEQAINANGASARAVSDATDVIPGSVFDGIWDDTGIWSDAENWTD